MRENDSDEDFTMGNSINLIFQGRLLPNTYIQEYQRNNTFFLCVCNDLLELYRIAFQHGQSLSNGYQGILETFINIHCKPKFFFFQTNSNLAIIIDEDSFVHVIKITKDATVKPESSLNTKNNKIRSFFKSVIGRGNPPCNPVGATIFSDDKIILLQSNFVMTMWDIKRGSQIGKILIQSFGTEIENAIIKTKENSDNEIEIAIGYKGNGATTWCILIYSAILYIDDIVFYLLSLERSYINGTIHAFHK